MEKETFQPKDTGKLTNKHYGMEDDKRTEEVLTDHGTVNMTSIVDKEK
ncbi:hypothetical protein IMZ08_10295 [Bacillus luteolus]|uniref:Uncharacterized protein n=1 Tax=Litchfieldia luteola TaxID=682179 RepID=A0ABR9QIX5_9BACI|nr:hypothetical protein [Cytobacillus luteolus]MBE4908445.1 hypothetical protein [Cytobacillus luteolus]MBP1941293.1 hypothetical protein [Cytobacillus luteolus]